MTKRFIAAVLIVTVVPGLSGCVAGYNSVLFTTKTNVGLVIDTQTPEVNVDIGRQEGLLAPSYEDGKTPPVLASFRFDGEGFFSNYLGSAFATGDAAVAMARLYDSPDWEKLEGQGVWDDMDKQCWKDVEEKFDSGIELTQEPILPWPVPKMPPNQVRPVLFGTDTSLGFKVKWSGVQGAVPDYLRLAYQRRELAFAAVTVGGKRKEDTGQIVGEASVPSLLATVDADLETKKFLDSNIGYIQYFASGSAATSLALRRGVRTAMLKRLDPEQDKIRVEKEYKREAQNTELALGLQERIKEWLDNGGAADVAALESAATAARTEAGARSPANEELGRRAMAAEELANAAKAAYENLEPPHTLGQAHRVVLRRWLRARGVQVLPETWLKGAPTNDLEDAIRRFDIY